MKLTRGEGIRPYAETDPNELCPASVLRYHRLQIHQRGRRKPVRPISGFGPEREPNSSLQNRLKKKTSDFLAAEMSARLATGPVIFRVLVQLAEPGDNVTDSTSVWPETRTEAEFGILTIKERVDELAPAPKDDL